MADYNKTTDFATKDSLPSGNPAKLILGTEIDVEFEAIEDSIATKLDSTNPTMTGTVTVTGDLDVSGTLTAGTIDGGSY